MRAARVDANQSEIVAALRKAGVFVQILSAVGEGVPDLLTAYNGLWSLLEVKDSAKSPSAQKLTSVQITWHATAKQYAPVYVVNNVEQAMIAVMDSRMNALAANYKRSDAA